MLRHAKIVATLGPASCRPETIAAMLRAGLDVVRLNTSHGTVQEHEQMIALVREVAEREGKTTAILMDLGFDPSVFNGLFMIARTPGLVAHVNEEQTRERPMRRIHPEHHSYDGPLDRSLA